MSSLAEIFCLIEGKLEDLQKKYPQVNVKEIMDADPSPTKKYSEWMIKQLLSGVKKDDLIPTIDYFNKNQQRFKEKDIYRYKSLKDLEDAAKSISAQSKTKQKQVQKSEGTKQIFEDADVIVLRIDTKNACIFYGSNTRWCITMKDANYYEQYKSQNIVFYFILRKVQKNDGYDKVAVVHYRDHQNKVIETEYFDQNDNPINEHDVAYEVFGEQDKPHPYLIQLLRKTQHDAFTAPVPFEFKAQKGQFAPEEYFNYIKNVENPNDIFKIDQRVAVNENIPTEVADYLVDFYSFKGRQDRDVEDWYHEEDYQTVVSYLLKSRKVSIDILIKLIKLSNKRLIGDIIFYNASRLPSDVLKKIISNFDFHDYYLDQMVEETSDPEILEIILNKRLGSAHVASEIIKNKATTPELLEKIALNIDKINSEEWRASVLAKIVQDTRTSEKTLRIIYDYSVNHDHTIVQAGLLFNPKTPDHIFNTIANSAESKWMKELVKQAKEKLKKESKSTSLFWLFEGKIDLLKAKYPNIDVEQVFNSDPSPTKKYAEWMLKQITKGVKTEDLIPTIQFFNKNQNKFDLKDINQYKSLKDLEDAAKDISLKPSTTQKRKIQKTEGTEKIWEDEECVVLRMDTKEACILYGSNTRWCITMANAQYYENYKASNVIFYFILRKSPHPEDQRLNKVAIAYQRAEDNRIFFKDFFDTHDNQMHDLTSEPPVKNIQKILNLTHVDAIKQPKAFMARIKSGEYSREELVEYYNSIKDDDDAVLDLIEKVKSEDLIIFLDTKSKYIATEVARLIMLETHDETDLVVDLWHKTIEILDKLINQVSMLDKKHKRFEDEEDEGLFVELLKRLKTMKDLGIETFKEDNFYNVIVKHYKNMVENFNANGWFDKAKEAKVLNNDIESLYVNVRNLRNLKSYSGLSSRDFEYMYKEKYGALPNETKNESKLSLSNVFSEWSQHLDKVMFFNDEEEDEKEDEEKEPFKRVNPYEPNQGLETAKVSVAGTAGAQTGRFPGGRNQPSGRTMK